MPPKEFTPQNFSQEQQQFSNKLRPEVATRFFDNEQEQAFFEQLIGGTYKDVMNLVAADMMSGEQMMMPAHRDEIFLHLLNNGYAPLPVDFPRDLKGSVVWAEKLKETQDQHDLPLPRLVDLAEYTAGLTPQIKLNAMVGLDPVTRGVIEARRASVRAIAERIFNNEEPFAPGEENEYAQGTKLLPIVFKSMPETESRSEISFHSFGPGTPLAPHPASEVRQKVMYIAQKYGIPPSM